MKKIVKTFAVNVKYHADHARAHYTIDGLHYGNGGEAVEWVIKDAFNLPAVKDACGGYDVTDDVPEFGVSVKSSNATLVNKPLGDNFDAVLDAYMETVHSRLVWYGVADFNHKCVTIYEMTLAEFARYLRKFARWDGSRKVIRLMKDSAKNIAWLNANARG